MPRTLRIGSPRGFTLLEVIVAMSIAGLVMACVYGVFAGVTSSELRLQVQADRLQVARYIIARIEPDLHNALADDTNSSNFSQPPTEPLRLHTRDAQGKTGLVEYVFKDRNLTRTWIPDEKPVVTSETDPAQDPNGIVRMELSSDLLEWTWAVRRPDQKTDGYPNAVQVKFRWSGPTGAPGSSFERLVALEARLAESQ